MAVDGSPDVHVHIDTPRDASPWLPYEHRGGKEGLRKQPHCRSCGLVKNVGPDRARGLGFYANALARMRRDLQDKRLNDVTTRLVMQRLSTYEGFEDRYAMTAYAQELVFARAVHDIAGIDEATVIEAL